MNAITPLKLSKAEFHRWLDSQPHEQRYELVNGVPKMMTRVRNAHNAVVVNWVMALGAQLDRHKYAIHTGEYALATNTESYRLPDVSVSMIDSNAKSLEMTEPQLVVEVLSPSTSYIDLNEKVEEYLALASLQAYVICAQDSRLVWTYLRDKEGQWPQKPVETSAKDDCLVIDALGLSISLADLYFGVSVDNP
jgi:Uma2 family endonuclease